MPRLDTTPPVTKMYFADIFASPCLDLCAGRTRRARSSIAGRLNEGKRFVRGEFGWDSDGHWPPFHHRKNFPGSEAGDLFCLTYGETHFGTAANDRDDVSWEGRAMDARTGANASMACMNRLVDWEHVSCFARVFDSLASGIDGLTRVIDSLAGAIDSFACLRDAEARARKAFPSR